MLLRLFRQGTTGKQRFSQLFWMCDNPMTSAVAHSNASVDRRVVDFVVVFGAVNVNETLVRVGVVFIKAIKPQGPRRDQILRRRKWIDRQYLSRPIYFE